MFEKEKHLKYLDDSIKQRILTLLICAHSPEQRGLSNEGFVKSIKEDNKNVQFFIIALNIERERFTESNKEVMQYLIDILVDSEIYPQSTPVMAEHNYSHMKMVEAWGADWYKWSGICECPHCKADWRDHESGPPFKYQIGIEIKGIYDGILYYQCPICQQVTSRNGNKLSDNSIINPTKELLVK